MSLLEFIAMCSATKSELNMYPPAMIGSPSRYQATFVFHDAQHVTSAGTLADVNDGFWVNSDYEFTRMSDALYYILPHMIKEIKKVKPND